MSSIPNSESLYINNEMLFWQFSVELIGTRIKYSLWLSVKWHGQQNAEWFYDLECQ